MPVLIRVCRTPASRDMLEAPSELFLRRGVPGFIPSGRTPENSLRGDDPEFLAGHVRRRITTVGVMTACIEPGSPCENGYVESFDVRFRDELLNRRLFTSLREAQILIGRLAPSLRHGRVSKRPRLPTAGTGNHRAAKPAVPARHQHDDWTNRSELVRRRNPR